MLYGKEIIIDLYECDSNLFNRENLEIYFRDLCKLIDMKRSELYFWDDVGISKEERQTEPHLKGTSAVQFITTSNITIHTLDLLNEVYINIFSCKEFDAWEAGRFTKEYFKGKYQRTPAVIIRGIRSKR